VVSAIAPRQNRHEMWECQCDCGRTKVVRAENLKRGSVVSCGCYRAQLLKKHGMAGDKETRTYASWRGMIDRCTNPGAANYGNYGGRGIKVCERWRDFRNFLADMGERPKRKTLDRIDVNGNYEPGNCRWASPFEQARNKQCHAAQAAAPSTSD